METDKRDDGPEPGSPNTWPMYLGPYEVWNFGVAGKRYAFPVMQKPLRYITALAEFGRPVPPPPPVPASAAAALPGPARPTTGERSAPPTRIGHTT